MLIVALVLTLLLGSLPAALAVVLGIPVAMSIAVLGMRIFGVTGDLMSLGYSLIFFPAILSLVPPAKGHGPRWVTALTRGYGRLLPKALRFRYLTMLAAVAALVVTSLVFASAGAEFVPRIFEGDAVITIRRAPSISLQRAQELDLRVERILHGLSATTTPIS
jgi:cobalt-zinc-cadmium resistance protein CzcA